MYSEDPGEQSFLSARSDPDATKDSILDNTLAEVNKSTDLATHLLDKDGPDHKLDPSAWCHGDYMTTWLEGEANLEEIDNPWNSSDFEKYPGTALITNWGSNTKLTASKLSQFPRGGLEGLF